MSAGNAERGLTVKQEHSTFRVPKDLLHALRRKAAEETIKRNERVTLPALAVEILWNGIKAKGKWEGTFMAK
jgi:hypothetical protein